MRILSLAVCLWTLLMAATVACAAPLFYEGFDYAVGTTVGPEGSWTTNSGGGLNVVAPGGTYADGSGNVLQTSGNSTFVPMNNQWISIGKALPQSVSDLFAQNGTIYASFLIKEYASLGFVANPNTAEQVLINVYSGIRGAGYYNLGAETQLNIWPENTNMEGSTGGQFYWNATNWALWGIRIVMQDGPDEITVLRNPPLTGAVDWDTGFTTINPGPNEYGRRADGIKLLGHDVTASGFSELRVGSAGGVMAWEGAYYQGGVDEIRIDRNWQEAAPIAPPDPGEGFYEGFDYTEGSTIGNEGGWTTMSGYSGFDILAPGGSYGDPGGNALEVSGNHAYSQFDLSIPSAQRKYNSVKKELSTAAKYLLSRNGTVYMSFLLKEAAGVTLLANPDTADQMLFSVSTGVTTVDHYNLNVGMQQNIWPDNVSADISSAPAMYWNWTDWAFVAVRIVMRDGNDEVTAIRNPTNILNPDWDTASSSRLVIDTLDISSSAYSQIRLMGLGGKKDDNWIPEEHVGGVDEIRIQSAWADCVPTTLAQESLVEYTDEVTVDGNLGDWADAAWKPFDRVYDSTPSDIATGSAWAVKWGAGGTRVYMAVKINDTAHFFTDTYTGWNARDAVELYLHTTGVGEAYAATQTGAQEWAIGIMNSNRSAVWSNVGATPVYTASASEFIGAGREDGAWLYYEAAITPFEYFAGRVGGTSIISPLFENDWIGNDVTAIGRNATAYTGMKSSGHAEGGWYNNFAYFAQHRLVRSGVKGTITLQGFSGSTMGAGSNVVITDASSASETHNLVLDGSGTYSFQTALRGACTAVASAGGYLPDSEPVTVDANGDGSVNFTLVKQTVVLPEVGASNKAVLDSIMDSAASKYTWVLWGKVSDRTAGGFKLDDGSGVIITVTGTNSVANGDYVSVKGTLNATTKTLTSQGITNYSP